MGVFTHRHVNVEWELWQQHKDHPNPDLRRVYESYAEVPQYRYEVRRWVSVVSFLAAVSLVVWAGIAVGVYAARHDCEQTAEQMGLEEDFGIWSGCMVPTGDGEWRDIDDVRVDGGDL